MWVAYRERLKAPAPLPQNEEKQFTTLNIKKVEGTRTIFAVEASKSTDLKGQNISLLEDVRITVYGKNGDRNDVIHTQSCRYAKTDGSIQCEGKVNIELESADDAGRAATEPLAKPNIIHIETSAVTFERATGKAQTVQPVKFSFPNGDGDGVGAVYQSDSGKIQLVRDVHIRIQPTAAPGKAGKGSESPVEMSGSSMLLDKMQRTADLLGPASANTEAQRVTAGKFTLRLDTEFRAQTLIATPGSLKQRPEVTEHGAKGESVLKADQLTANLAPQGWTETILAEGNLEGSSPNGALRAERGELEMWPRVNQAKLLTLRGYVRSKLSADRLMLDFGPRGKARVLNANGAVQSEREAPGHGVQTASAATGVVQLSPAGDWTQITLHGNVKLQDAERNAEAQQAVFAHAAQTTVLTGEAVVRDASSETHAPRITFEQASGDIEAEGPVRSTDFSSKTSSLRMSPTPANITADHLRANSKTGRALYTGHARLWQGPSVMEADSIELFRETRVLKANGSVRAVFRQNAQTEANAGPAPIWHVSAGTLTYWDAEDKAHLEKDVFVQSADQRMRAPQLDLYFTRNGSSKTGGGGTSEISRAAGTGGVIVEQGDRRGTAEQGLYTAADEKFVLSGGTPTLFDPVEGTTTGRELTFYRADDTIIVDSGNGMRTMTRHRVPR